MATLESVCGNSEYWRELGLVLFVIGMCKHFDISNCRPVKGKDYQN